jgi:mannosyl-glycoprotein endo-beta-N-acetylglucosaminidase
MKKVYFLRSIFFALIITIPFLIFLSEQSGVSNAYGIGSESVLFLSDQPYASYWHPNDLLTWSPGSDPDAPYNRSFTDRKDRFLNINTQVNSHARAAEAKISPLDIFWATSGNPSQGSLDIDYFAFNYWQYIDVLVFWGGSASEGLILAPNPGVIDAAHRNGIPVLGTVFFPPLVYGGNIQWVWDLVQKSGNTFPVADKLIEVAEYYGFDGYFINQETAGGTAALAESMIEFIKYFQENSSLEIMWYDAMIESGSISWQNQLNSNNDRFFQDVDTLVSEHMFLNFWWNATLLSNSRNYANNLGRSEFDLYAGVDVQANGYNTFANWGAIFPESNPHVMSLAFYVPSWTYHSSTNVQDFYVRANRFWVGENRDPANTAGSSNWKGLAHYVPAKSVINDLPFVTNFCTGHGYDFYINGEKRSHPDWSITGWNNLSLQDILPSWRWIVESSGTALYPNMDWTDAYYGGNCVKISGDLTSDNEMKLFKTKLGISGNTKLDIAFKMDTVGLTHMKVGLAFESNPVSFTYFNVDSAGTADWNLKTFDLGAHSGDTVAVISLFFEGGFGSGYEMKIGRIALYNGAISTPAAASNVVIENKVNEPGDLVTLRMKWDHSPSNVYYYNVYRRNPDSSLTYLGGTPNNAYFVPMIKRVAGDSLVTVEVEAVGLDFGHSAHATTTFLWYSAPGPATNPSPADSAVNVYRNEKLTWTAGSNTFTQDVYLDTINPPLWFRGNQTGSVFDPGLMDENRTYYWRINEINNVDTTEGEVWMFTTGTLLLDSLGKSLQFDGSDDFVDCGNDTSLQITGNQITLEAWIYASAFKNEVWQGCVVTKDQNDATAHDCGYMIRVGGSGMVNFNLGNNGWNEINTPANAVSLNTWHHIAVTYDGGMMRIYVDGQEAAASAKVITIGNAVSRPLLIGDSPQWPGRCFEGNIDEVRVWKVARSLSQIQATMHDTLGASYYLSSDSGLVGYWRMDEGSGQVTVDLSVNNNLAILGSTTGNDDNDPVWAGGFIIPTGINERNLNLVPEKHHLEQNYPNPFNPLTQIEFDVSRSGKVQLKVYDIQGRLVSTLVDRAMNPGAYKISFRPDNMASGVYFYRIQIGEFISTRKMVLLR